MRWARDPIPAEGAERHRAGFLLFPKRIGDEWRWLESAAWVEVYFASAWRPSEWNDEGLLDVKWPK